MGKRHSINLKEIHIQSTKDAVIEAIHQYIIEHQLKEGDPFPTEQQLAEQLKVSRNILREALQYFKTLGMISSKPKTGAFIKALVPQDPYKNYLPFLKSDKALMQDICEMRFFLEQGMASSIFQKITDDDIKALKEILEQMPKSCTKKDLVQIDIHFHTRLWEITGNQILMSLKPLTVDFFEKSEKKQHKKIEEIVKIHRKIISSLELGDKIAFKKAIAAHYDKYS